MTTASTGRRRRAPAFDLSAYQSEAQAFTAELGEARAVAATTGTASVAPIYAAHASLFSRDAVEALDRLAAEDKKDAGQAAALRGFASEGFTESRVADLSDRITAAEMTAVILWRGERIGYRLAPQRIAEISERSERNALDASYREAVEAINPLRIERFEGLRAARAELGHDDPFAMNEAARGIGSGDVLSQMQRFLVESETTYFAALRRFLAEIDIEQGDASIADLWHVLRGRGWDAWFIGRRLQSVVGGTFGELGLHLGSQPGLSLDLDGGAPGEAAAVGVRVPGDVRIVLGQSGGYGDYLRLLRALGQGMSLAAASADAPAAYRIGGDDSVDIGYGWVFESLMLEPDWLQTELGMGRDELVPWLDFAGFVQLHQVRRTIAGVLYEQRLHGPGSADLQRAYYAGTMSLLTGVRHPESSYLADAPDHLAGIRRFRGWCFGSSLADWLRQQHGSTWWRSDAAGQELRQGWGRARALNAAALVAHLGYDQLDWRPVLRQIRTRLIGEMSGYGGPNITTRAGTRKV